MPSRPHIRIHASDEPVPTPLRIVPPSTSGLGALIQPGFETSRVNGMPTTVNRCLPTDSAPAGNSAAVVGAGLGVGATADDSAGDGFGAGPLTLGATSNW